MDNSLVKDLVFPGVVAVLAAFFSYFGTYRLNKQTQEEDKRLKTIDLIDYLLIDFNKLITTLEKLKEDTEKYNFFLLANIEIAKSIVYKLKAQTEKVILFSEDNLRRQILENVDFVSSIVEEMDVMERYPVNEASKLEYTRSERLRELRNIRLKLLEMGYYIDASDNSKIKYFDEKERKKNKSAKDTRLETIEKILLDLVSDINSSEQNLNKIRVDNEKKRSFLVIRILDIQTKLREINILLNDNRNQFIN